MLENKNYQVTEDNDISDDSYISDEELYDDDDDHDDYADTPEEYMKKFGYNGYVSFYGNDHCSNCPGWDGVSNRCECRNRRMIWSTNDSMRSYRDKRKGVYPRAY